MNCVQGITEHYDDKKLNFYEFEIADDFFSKVMPQRDLDWNWKN